MLDAPRHQEEELMRYSDPDLVADDLADLRAEAQWERRRHNMLMRHPDCRDPDHPGCESCADDDDES